MSLVRQEKIARAVELNMAGKKKHEIAAELECTLAQVDAWVAKGRRQFIDKPTTEAVNDHRAKLEALLESLEGDALNKGKLFTIDRYLQTLDRIAALSGVNYADRSRNPQNNSGSEIDQWLRGSVENGGFGNDEQELLGPVIDEYDDDLEEATIDDIEQDVEEVMAGAFHTPHEPEDHDHAPTAPKRARLKPNTKK